MCRRFTVVTLTLGVHVPQVTVVTLTLGVHVPQVTVVTLTLGVHVPQGYSSYINPRRACAAGLQ